MPESYRFFTPRAAQTFRAAASRILTPDDISSGGDDPRVLHGADAVMASRSAAEQRDLHRFLRVLEEAPRLRYGRPFSRLDDGQRDAVLRFLANAKPTKVRLGLMALKFFCLMAYYTDPVHFEEIGYPGPRMDAPFFRQSVSKREAGDGGLA